MTLSLEGIEVTRSYNCTFMELKFLNEYFANGIFDAYNCTFMELKSPIMVLCAINRKLIIAPLWNWNSAILLTCLKSKDTYNCTFMELKFRVFNFVGCFTHSYNCTFMELKFSSSAFSFSLANLIIAPLWNWNI